MDKRKESGAIQLSDDWPGVFIRCDEAAYYASTLSGIGGDTRELRSLLRSCRGSDKGVTRYVHAPEGSVVLRPGESRKQDRDRLDTLRAQLAHAHLKIDGLQKRIPPEGSVVLSAEEAKALLTRESYIHNTMPVYGNIPVTNEKVVRALLERLTSDTDTDP